ncbi:hypothetical protein BDV23DRAFT_151464 [Aspergillus alliaceus]|uniref:DSBA-like thioredoxin domain-containing protein n=1 Tax=Petromyces alliaceus TaxID=209559 RepID=A0A5N7CDS6_PETAA|nr:hypothetical protein BDV23DRAFT_151464 [Aspergillus alliaceus]
MGKRIECYIDCVSPYSFYAFTYLQKNAAALESLGVEIEYIPVFLGGINVSSGNKPPWTLPAKAAYSKYDGERAQKYFGHKFDIPSWWPILSLLTPLPKAPTLPNLHQSPPLKANPRISIQKLLRDDVEGPIGYFQARAFGHGSRKCLQCW